MVQSQSRVSERWGCLHKVTKSEAEIFTQYMARVRVLCGSLALVGDCGIPQDVTSALLSGLPYEFDTDETHLTVQQPLTVIHRRLHVFTKLIKIWGTAFVKSWDGSWPSQDAAGGILLWPGHLSAQVAQQASHREMPDVAVISVLLNLGSQLRHCWTVSRWGNSPNRCMSRVLQNLYKKWSAIADQSQAVE